MKHKKTIMKKELKNRRKAIDCKLIKPSKDNPGYFKYEITIEEIDGKIHKVPAYGIDMQDAIKRLLKDERDVKIKKIYISKIEPTVLGVFIVGWISTILISAITLNYKFAYYGIMSFLTLALGISVYRIIKGHNG